MKKRTTAKGENKRPKKGKFFTHKNLPKKPKLKNFPTRPEIMEMKGKPKKKVWPNPLGTTLVKWGALSLENALGW